VVLNAASLSPQSGKKPFGAAYILEALRGEYRKLGRTLPPQLENLTG
jgi:hypothetical protein